MTSFDIGSLTLAEVARRIRGRSLSSRDVVTACLDRAAANDGLGASITIDPEQVLSEYTRAFNLTGHPVISLPCGRTSAGLPVGVQLVGPRNEDEALPAIARTFDARSR